MFTVALVSGSGGSGRSSLAVALVDLIQRRGHSTLALDFDPQNLLGTYLGAVPPPAEGIASRAGRSQAWADTALINPQQVRLLPHGETTPASRAEFELLLARQPDWLRRQLALIELDGEAVCVIDSMRLPSIYAAQACAAADCVLAVLAPNLPSLATARRLPTPGAGQHFAWVLNGFDPRLRLQQDLRLLTSAYLPGDVPLFVVHRDESLPEAQAADQPLAEYAPHCQAMFDLQAISTWLLTLIRGEVVSRA